LSNIAIKVENLGKLYRLGEVGTGTISHDLNRWWARMRGKEDPFAQIGETNDRTSKGSSDYVWALKNVDFEVKQGEVLGIIGRNGAGKSTLLKLLSKVTQPTAGNIKVRGRIASLLEVGTGFHPEMTGRENIFQNGAILGMRKAEIRAKFDEIVDFAGVERYIDTPVKRYSSGMYVRLAFAVAAFLEPEILIIDEVLAVGDADFQKKCLGRMKDVSVNDGRTVLFVSHNMAAVRGLCENGLLLRQGGVEYQGAVDAVVDRYLQEADTEVHKSWSVADAPGTAQAKLLEIEINKSSDINYIDEPLDIYIKAQLVNSTTSSRMLNFSLVLYNQEQVAVFNVGSGPKAIKGDVIEAVCHIPADLLNDDSYVIRILLVEDESKALFDLNDIISFKMEERERGGAWHGKWIGTVRPQKMVTWTF
jgi:lipopolysaccharide transport system ATP-binding protein